MVGEAVAAALDRHCSSLPTTRGRIDRAVWNAGGRLITVCARDSPDAQLMTALEAPITGIPLSARKSIVLGAQVIEENKPKHNFLIELFRPGVLFLAGHNLFDRRKEIISLKIQLGASHILRTGW